jgi:predicted nucleotide-binding protein
VKANLEKYKNELDMLVKMGTDLKLAILYDCYSAEFEKMSPDDDRFKKLPNFTEKYQSWYSGSKLIIKQLLPDRLDDFTRHYEKPKSRKNINVENYRIADYLEGLYFRSNQNQNKIATSNHFIQQLEILKAVSAGLESKQFLNSRIDEIQEYGLKNSVADVLPKKNTTVFSNKIFIIHGHDVETKNIVATFIDQLGLEPVILHEQANQGRTIIEKFEDYSDVGYAIAIMTPDDTGSSVKYPNMIMKRARQNVIFELGYFLGKLGRKNIVSLVSGEIEMPTDYSGVLYIQIDDSNDWKSSLIKELESVGYKVKVNRTI